MWCVGQKARIGLARACYSRASLLLLDDVLSAVDAPTAQQLIQQVFGKLLNGRTVVLVSHAGVGFIKPDYVVALENGRVVFQGPVLECCEGVQTLSNQVLSGTPCTSRQNSSVDLDGGGRVQVQDGQTDGLIQSESVASGFVKNDVYWYYFEAAGGRIFLFILIMALFLTNAAEVLNSWWLKEWVDRNSNEQVLFYIGIYAVFGLVVVLAQHLQLACVLAGSFWASKKIHVKLLKRILGAPLRFFETTPVGRIVNRFTKGILLHRIII